MRTCLCKETQVIEELEAGRQGGKEIYFWC